MLKKLYIGTYPIFQTSSVSKPVCSVFKIRHWIMFLEIGEVNFAKRMPLLHPSFLFPQIKLHTFSDNSQSTSVRCRNATERKTQCARASYNRSSVQAFEKSPIIKDHRKQFTCISFGLRQHFLLFGSNEGDKGESHRFLIHIHNMNSFQSFIS